MAAIAEHPRVSIRGPHGLGKTALCALIVHWFALTRDGRTDWKLPTLASSWRQVERFLWPEIHKWARRLRWKEVIGRDAYDQRTELLTLNLRLSTGEAFAMASDNSGLIEGAHAESLLYIFDESKLVPPSTWDSAEGAFSTTGEVRWLAVSTPGDTSGRFYEIHGRSPGYEDWHVRHVTAAEAISAGRISPQWVEQRKRQWGEGSAVYQNRVLGEFATEATVGVIPLAWVEQANERWRAWADAGKPGHPTAVGVDVGGGSESGDLSTIAIVISGHIVSEIRAFGAAIEPSRATMELTGQVAGFARKHQETMRYLVVDVIGVGAGVVHRLGELGLGCLPFNAARKTDFMDQSQELGFANWRAAGWWMLREALDPHSGVNIALPPDDELTGDLTAPKYTITSASKIQIESKDELRKRIGRSTDKADAVIHALIGPILAMEGVYTQGQREVVDTSRRIGAY